jgi:hypothetical protein
MPCRVRKSALGGQGPGKRQELGRRVDLLLMLRSLRPLLRKRRKRKGESTVKTPAVRRAPPSWRQLRTKVRLLPLRPKEARGILGAERENLEAAKAARRLRRCLMLMPSWKWELRRMGLRRMLWLLPKEAMEPKEAWINQRQISVLPGRPSRLSLRKTMVGRRERLEGLLREAAVERK